MTGLRVGHGYDVHRLAQGRPLILGGVTIPWEKGLDGHSDADVLTHAVMDALLGAAGMDDIGKLFPDCDNAFLNISSLTLLERVMKALTEQGWQVVNIDATLVAQAPKIAPYRQEMRCALARTLGIRPEHSMNLFLGGLPRRYEEAEGPCKLEACRFTIDTEKKRCVEVRRADLWE